MDPVIIVAIIALVIVVVSSLISIILYFATKKFWVTNSNRLYFENVEMIEKCRITSESVLKDINKFYLCICDLGLNKTYYCSNAIVSKSFNQPVKYVIKYSDVEYSFACLEKLDYCIVIKKKINMVNHYLNEIYNNISAELPLYIRIFTSMEQISIKICKVSPDFFKIKKLQFCFSYVSPGRRSHNVNIVPITLNLLKDIQVSVSQKISKADHMKSQRSAMTNDLREAIKKRDNYTCQWCGNSVYIEPTLLLEVDHIIPVSKGGKTVADNLQTLCWRCNRRKGNKI